MTTFHFQQTEDALHLFRDGIVVATATKYDRRCWNYNNYIDHVTPIKRDMKRNHDRRYVNVYEVTREYGGPEEGGWWYNNHRYIESFKFATPQEAEAAVEAIRAEVSQNDRGNIYSVLGGEKFVAYLENRRAASATKNQPRYE